jgi:hypothetical protein
MRQEAATTGSLTTKILSLSITPMAAIPLPSSFVAVVVAGHDASTQWTSSKETTRARRPV